MENQKKQNSIVKSAIRKLWAMLTDEPDMADYDSDKALGYWIYSLQVDVAYYLLKSSDMEKTEETIRMTIREQAEGSEDWLSKCVDFEKCRRNAEIRKEFAEALRNVREGSELSAPLWYSLSDEDIKNLAKLHKAGRFRKKIEDLLDDMNFHTECGLMKDKQYDALPIL